MNVWKIERLRWIIHQPRVNYVAIAVKLFIRLQYGLHQHLIHVVNRFLTTYRLQHAFPVPLSILELTSEYVDLHANGGLVLLILKAVSVEASLIKLADESVFAVVFDQNGVGE